MTSTMKVNEKILARTVVIVVMRAKPQIALRQKEKLAIVETILLVVVRKNSKAEVMMIMMMMMMKQIIFTMLSLI